MAKKLDIPEQRLIVPGAAAAAAVPITTHANLLHGVYGLCTVSGITLLHLFEWRVRVSQKLLEVTAHGDEWEQWVQLRQGWTGMAKGYLTRSATATYINGAAKLSAIGPAMTFTGYSDMGESTGAHKIIVGEILYEDITIEVPNAMVTQEITFRGSVAPTGGPAA